MSPSELPDSPRQIVPPFRLPYEKKDPPRERDVGKEEDMVKVFSKSGESAVASGMQSVRSLSPLTIDGETVGIDVSHELLLILLVLIIDYRFSSFTVYCV